MEVKFILEDEFHCEQCGEFESLVDAMAEVKRRSSIPWDQLPNVAPCTNWGECGRDYVILEYDTSSEPWREVSATLVLTISAKEVRWFIDQESQTE